MHDRPRNPGQADGRRLPGCLESHGGRRRRQDPDRAGGAADGAGRGPRTRDMVIGRDTCCRLARPDTATGRGWRRDGRNAATTVPTKVASAMQYPPPAPRGPKVCTPAVRSALASTISSPPARLASPRIRSRARARAVAIASVQAPSSRLSSPKRRGAAPADHRRSQTPRCVRVPAGPTTTPRQRPLHVPWNRELEHDQGIAWSMGRAEGI